jgi:site-specific DNA recombinase
MTALPCAIYTRKSSEEGLEQGFNSLDAQREACEAFILSQKALGWKVAGCYDDGGFSGGNVERPGLQRLLADIAAKRVRVVVVYKVDRLTRSLADFAKLVELFDAQGVSFVSVTQQFNTTSSMGRLTLNVLLSFAQFEREVTGERIRDKIAASKKKGMWMGGNAPMGYVPHERTLTVDEVHAQRVREIFSLYLELGSVYKLKAELRRRGWTTVVRNGDRGGKPFDRGGLYRMLANPIYIGQIGHKGVTYPGQHPAIIDAALWQAVQDLLAKNLRGHVTRSNAAEPSLLTGMLFDEQGARLQPTHATKGPRRYRYYFRNPGANQRPLRIPAPELELAVIDALVGFLRDDAQVMEALGDVDASVGRSGLERARQWARRLEVAIPSERIEILQRLVERITVGTKSLEIALRVNAICVEQSSATSDETTTIVVQVKLKRCGLAVRLIVRGTDEDQARGPNPRLVALLAKGQRWFSALQAGQYPSVLAIAQEHGVATKEATQVIYLAFMAPDIVQKIARGEQPMDLGVRKLQSMVPLPLEWGEQRRLLGFAR